MPNRKDVAFLRVGDENRRLTFAQRQELTYDKGLGTYETRLVSDAQAVDLADTLLDSYAEAVGAADPHALLEARGMARGGQLTVAGALLFADNAGAIFPEAHLRVLRYRGSQRGTGSRQQLIQRQHHESLLESPYSKPPFQVANSTPPNATALATSDNTTNRYSKALLETACFE